MSVNTSTVSEKPLPFPAYSSDKNEKADTSSTKPNLQSTATGGEDPMSDANRNKRISLEESNQRVRNWLNSRTSYFGPVDEENKEGKSEDQAAKAGKDASKHGATNVKTENGVARSPASFLQINKSENSPTKNHLNSSSNSIASVNPISQLGLLSSVPRLGNPSPVASMITASYSNQQMPPLTSLSYMLAGHPATVPTLLGATGKKVEHTGFQRDKTQLQSGFNVNRSTPTNLNIDSDSVKTSQAITGVSSNQRPTELDIPKTSQNRPAFLIENLFSSTSGGVVSSSNSFSTQQSSLEQLQRSMQMHQDRQHQDRQQQLLKFASDSTENQQKQQERTLNSPSQFEVFRKSPDTPQANVVKPNLRAGEAEHQREQQRGVKQEPGNESNQIRDKQGPPQVSYHQLMQQQLIQSQGSAFSNMLLTPSSKDKTVLNHRNSTDAHSKQSDNFRPGHLPVSSMPPLRVSPSIPQLKLPSGSPLLNQQQQQRRIVDPMSSPSSDVVKHNSPGLQRNLSANQISTGPPLLAPARSIKSEANSPVNTAQSREPHSMQYYNDLNDNARKNMNFRPTYMNLAPRPNFAANNFGHQQNFLVDASQINDLLRGGGPNVNQRQQLQQQFANAMKQRLIEQQRLIGNNPIRPHLNAASSPFRQGVLCLLL